MTLTCEVSTAARIAGIARTTGYAAAARGDLPGAVRVGGRWRVVIQRFADGLGLDPAVVVQAVEEIEHADQAVAAAQ